MITINVQGNTIKAEIMKRVTILDSRVELCRTVEGMYLVCLNNQGRHTVIPSEHIIGTETEKMDLFEAVVKSHKEMKAINDLSIKQFEWFYVPETIRSELRKALESKGYDIMRLRHTSNHPADGHMFTFLCEGKDKKPTNYIVGQYNASLKRMIDIHRQLTYPEAEKTMAMMIKDVSQS